MQDQPAKLVLYADDDTDDLEFVREAFSKHATDIELITFSSAIALIEFVRNRNIDEPLPCLVILDINMPKLDGKDALRLLRSMPRYDEVPAILFTTSTAPTDSYFAKYYNAGFFTKPLAVRQMDLIVKKFLDHCEEGIKK